MKKFFCLFFFLFISFSNSIKCQVLFDTLNPNNVSCLIVGNGSHFLNPETYERYFEVPKGSLKMSMGNLLIHLGAKDAFGAQYFSGGGSASTEFIPGPVSDNAGSDLYKQQWNRVWKVTKNEVGQHLNNFATTGYQTPEAILNWPSLGESSNGETMQLAPFWDVNQNGYYDPDLGDVPYLRGDMDVVFILNDKAASHQRSGGTPLEVEMVGTAYAFYSDNPLVIENPILENTIFFHYEIKNKSPRNYSELFLGILADFEVGYGQDDYIGVDSASNMIYGYNGDAIDGPQEPQHNYDSFPPCQALKIFNKPIAGFMPGYADYNHIAAYNWLKGYLNDTLRMMNSLTGQPTNFYQLNSTNCITNFAEKSTGIATIGPISLSVDSLLYLDYALVFQPGDGNGPYSPVWTIKNNNAQLDSLFKTINGTPNSLSPLTKQKPKFSVFPNPGSKLHFSIDGFGNGPFTLKIFNSIGAEILSLYTSNSQEQIEEGLASGIYFIEIQNASGDLLRKKWIKQN